MADGDLDIPLDEFIKRNQLGPTQQIAGGVTRRGKPDSLTPLERLIRRRDAELARIKATTKSVTGKEARLTQQEAQRIQLEELLGPARIGEQGSQIGGGISQLARGVSIITEGGPGISLENFQQLSKEEQGAAFLQQLQSFGQQQVSGKAARLRISEDSLGVLSQIVKLGGIEGARDALRLAAGLEVAPGEVPPELIPPEVEDLPALPDDEAPAPSLRGSISERIRGQRPSIIRQRQFEEAEAGISFGQRAPGFPLGDEPSGPARSGLEVLGGFLPEFGPPGLPGTELEQFELRLQETGGFREGDFDSPVEFEIALFEEEMKEILRRRVEGGEQQAVEASLGGVFTRDTGGGIGDLVTLLGRSIGVRELGEDATPEQLLEILREESPRGSRARALLEDFIQIVPGATPEQVLEDLEERVAAEASVVNLLEEFNQTPQSAGGQGQPGQTQRKPAAQQGSNVGELLETPGAEFPADVIQVMAQALQDGTFSNEEKAEVGQLFNINQSQVSALERIMERRVLPESFQQVADGLPPLPPLSREEAFRQETARGNR